MQKPQKDQIRLFKSLGRLKIQAENCAVSSHVTDRLQDIWRDFQVEIAESCQPASISEVRRLPEFLWPDACCYVLNLLDTTLECDEDESHPDFLCTDNALEDLIMTPDEVVIAMVKSGTVETPQELIAWIESRVEQLA